MNILNVGRCFNPLNQVYVFNMDNKNPNIRKAVLISFNPLNQVYVFNTVETTSLTPTVVKKGFNPLNQVYVFNNAPKDWDFEDMLNEF